MVDHLVFTLCATMAAMGEFGGHERRNTLNWPGRSSVLGLVAAALGIRRDDAAGLARLESLRVAVGIMHDGTRLRDYHTIETVPSAAAKRPDSRHAALTEAGRLHTNTTITLRDYRVGVAYGVALWGAPLDGLAQALQHPVFTLYLGRKSCPLSSPTDPKLVSAANAAEALTHMSVPPFCPPAPIWLVASDEPIAPGDAEDTRNDVAIDRDKWHFASRRVYMHRPTIKDHAA
jgi:CRISPR system Cascade subunit CasD